MSVTDALAVVGAFVCACFVLVGLVHLRTAVVGGECRPPLREDVRGNLAMVSLSTGLVFSESFLLATLVWTVVA
ncbi:hypothetical protein GCM10023328_28040 [Modestobacter marinus]|uniref:Uncharacterized protein n=1 Tax=Modestobacter marinus TaxID=477641 RepID=A0A846M2Q0_9ACTN|nr:hypothetical protein [Modestobacter marinus]NIH69919.1 hypothetical protein [Modestobacter marinus]GGL80583.1 hypothetical protein GCM10011589_41040 [Modestobacter marinus]